MNAIYAHAIPESSGSAHSFTTTVVAAIVIVVAYAASPWVAPVDVADSPSDSSTASSSSSATHMPEPAANSSEGNVVDLAY